MSARQTLLRHGRELAGFAAMLTDDSELAERLLVQAVRHTVDDTADRPAAVRVWLVRGLLSEDYELGRPVAQGFDVPAGDQDGDLATRLDNSSRLQRAVVALHYGEHLDAAAVARVVGGSEDELGAYLDVVRARLGVRDDALELRRLLRSHVDAGCDRWDDAAARLVDLVPRSDAEQAELTRAAEAAAAEAEAAAQAAAVQVAAVQAEAAAREEAARDAAVELEAVRAAAAEEGTAAAERVATLHQDLAALRAHVQDELAAQNRATDEQLAAASARAAQDLAEVRRIADEQLAAAAEQADRDRAELRRAADEQLVEQRQAAEAAAEASASAVGDLQVRLGEQTERTRAAEVAHLAELARVDEVVADLRHRLEQAEAQGVTARAEQAERDAVAAETARIDAERAETERAETERAETERAETERAETERAETERAETERAETERAAAASLTDHNAHTDRDDRTDASVVDEFVAGELVPPAAEVLPARPSVADEVDAMFRLSVRKPPPYPSLRVVRPLIALTVVLGLNYLVWRWIFSINWSAWWIAVPLVIAETYSLLDSMIFGFTMWRLKRRPEPEPPPEDATVDVFITTYNEPLDLVMKTARAAQRITFPHTLWILDDGNRPELRELAGSEGIGVISRSTDWIDMPRHAKAGNLNNALMVTQGEFIVILDADQVPAPELLDRTLGYFRDERMAVVQTPQFFVNVPRSDPLGSQAPLFYGPIQQGKDGWNSAFFCGSNAVLRREALLQMGIRRYVHELQIRIDDALNTAEKVIKRARAKLPADQPAVAEALQSVLEAARDVRAQLAGNESIADATASFQRRVHQAARRVVEQDLAESRADLDEIFELVDEQIAEVTAADAQNEALDRLARRDWSPLGAIETVSALIAVVDVDREDEAQPIMPMSTISVTEDMATCMRMHSMGWKSAYHDEILAVGLAPEDLGTMLTQRLRWAQGTMQVMLRENPLRQKGLSFAQKIMYLGTMWSYLSGFAALAYIAAPVIYLVFGVLPVDALSVQFFARLIPFLIVNQLLFFVIGRGRSTWRGQQYSLALFPVWIEAVTSAVANVVFGRSLTFAVTPKERVQVAKLPWRLVRHQLTAMGLLIFAAGIGVLRLVAGQATTLGTTINLVWVAFDLVLFSAVIRAVLYRGFRPAVAPPVPEPTTEPQTAATLQEVTR